VEGDLFALFCSRFKQKFSKEIKELLPQEHQLSIKLGGGG
jgi:hypothetical protein